MNIDTTKKIGPGIVNINPSVLVGIIPPLATPFKADGTIDEPALRSEVRFLINAGVHGISFGGSSGEGSSLSASEIERGIQILAEENREGIPLVCGIISNSTSDAINKATAARNAGADVLMVTPTHYHGTDAAGNISYYNDISDAVQLPVIIYNVIDRNPISPELMLKLCQIEQVIGIKQSVGGLHAINAMIAKCGGLTKIYGAQDDLLFCSYLLGVDGAISAILTLFPELCVRQWNAIKSGNITGAKEIHFCMLPVWQLVIGAGMSFPGRLKSVLKIMGRHGGLPRRPILEPSRDVYNELLNALKQANLIP
jgi:dihydrodipicolinate synthase/N-acetylneuraminate lyase